jgi:hypothetical protein
MQLRGQRRLAFGYRNRLPAFWTSCGAGSCPITISDLTARVMITFAAACVNTASARNKSSQSGDSRPAQQQQLWRLHRRRLLLHPEPHLRQKVSRRKNVRQMNCRRHRSGYPQPEGCVPVVCDPDQVSAGHAIRASALAGMALTSTSIRVPQSSADRDYRRICSTAVMGARGRADRCRRRQWLRTLPRALHLGCFNWMNWSPDPHRRQRLTPDPNLRTLRRTSKP